MTLIELMEKFKGHEDLEIAFDLNGEGAVPVRDSAIELIADDKGETHERFIVLTNVEGMFLEDP